MHVWMLIPKGGVEASRRRREKKKNLTQKRNFNGGQDSKDVHSLIIS